MKSIVCDISSFLLYIPSFVVWIIFFFLLFLLFRFFGLSFLLCFLKHVRRPACHSALRRSIPHLGPQYYDSACNLNSAFSISRLSSEILHFGAGLKFITQAVYWEIVCTVTTSPGLSCHRRSICCSIGFAFHGSKWHSCLHA